jgi:hypothetical protein
MTEHKLALSFLRERLATLDDTILWATSNPTTSYMADSLLTRADSLRRSIAVLEADQTVPVEKESNEHDRTNMC